MNTMRKHAQVAIIAIYVAAWAVSLFTVCVKTANERFSVPLELTAAFLLTLGICSVPELISGYKAFVGKGKTDEPK
jgi:hypothetical protein